jgi:hypothetical protein
VSAVKAHGGRDDLYAELHSNAHVVSVSRIYLSLEQLAELAERRTGTEASRSSEQCACGRGGCGASTAVCLLLDCFDVDAALAQC